MTPSHDENTYRPDLINYTIQVKYIFKLPNFRKFVSAILCLIVGYEKGLFKRMNEKQATEKEAYLWSVSDM